MTIHTNLIQKTVLLVFFTSLTFPTYTFAQIITNNTKEHRQNTAKQITINNLSRKGPSSNNNPATSSSQKLGFCSQIEKALVVIDNKTDTTNKKRAANNNKEKNGSTHDMFAKVEMQRTENETKRKEHLAELVRRASTTEQKRAVEKFATILTDAVTTRDKAIDSLLSVHRNEMNMLEFSRMREKDKAFAVLAAAIEDAKEQAKKDCVNNIDGDTVRNNLKSSIEKSQRIFKAQIASIEKINTINPNDTQLKKDSITKIENEFKANMENARMSLKSALQEHIEIATTTNRQ